MALLGRNTAIGTAFAALLFGALLYGTSSRSLDPNVFDPSLAGNLTTMIQALVLLFIGADVLILYLWHRRGRPRPRLPRLGRRHHVPPEAAVSVVAVEHATSRPAGPPVLDRARDWALAAHPARGQGDRDRRDRARDHRVLDRPAARWRPGAPPCRS